MKSPFQQYSRFYAPDAAQQQAAQVVDISDWSIGGDFNPYEQGTRAKYEVYCPQENPQLSFLIGGHRYLYKKCFERGNGYIHHEQFWVEIVAYHLGRVMGVEVPPAFVARRAMPIGQPPEYACLIEWFYGYPHDRVASSKQGGDLIIREIAGYDREKGRQHNFQTIQKIMQQEHVIDWLENWTRILLFDALIGNTDRHQENWEIIITLDENDTVCPYLSPAFDNGTALGFQILEEGIAHKMNGLEGYICKGTHHLKWQLEDEKQAGHFELLAKLTEAFPVTQEVMAEVVASDITRVYDTIRSFTAFNIENPLYRLTEQRAEFMIALIAARVQKAREILKR